MTGVEATGALENNIEVNAEGLTDSNEEEGVARFIEKYILKTE